MTDMTYTDIRPVSGVFSRIAAWAAERHQRRIDRDAFRNLLSLDDQMLKDIGVTRDEVRRASDLPLSVNAALELETLAKNRQNW